MTTFFWTKYPFVRVGFTFMLGIFLAYLQIKLPEYLISTQHVAYLHIAVCLISLIALLLFVVNSKIKLVMILFVFCCLGYIRFVLEDPRQNKGHIYHYKGQHIEQIQGLIITEPTIKLHQTNFVLSIHYLLQNKKWIKHEGHINVYTKDRQNYCIGQTLAITGKITPIKQAHTPFDFDYAQHMAYQKIYQSVYTSENPIILKTHTPHLLINIKRQATTYRKQIEAIIKKHIVDTKHQGVLIGLVTGTRSNLSAEDKKLFTDSGTIHILAISGMHIVLIYQVLMYLFLRLKSKDQNVYINLFVFCLIWFYIFMTGLQASTVRAGIMISIVLLGKITHKHPQHINSLFATAFIMLLYNPYYIADIGFCLSFLAIIGILLVSEISYTQTGISLYLLKSSAISTAAQVATLPYTIFLFQQFPVYFLLANMILVPLSTCMLFGTIGLLCTHSIPYLSDLVITLLNILCQLLFKTLYMIQELPLHLINHLTLTSVEVLLLYLVLTFTLIAIYTKKKYWLWALSVTCILLSTSIQSRVIIAYHTNSLLICGTGKKRTYCIVHRTEAYIFKEDLRQPNLFATEQFLSDNMVKKVTNISLPTSPNFYIQQGPKTLFICRQEDIQKTDRIKKTSCCIIDYKNKYSYITHRKNSQHHTIYSDGKKTMHVKELSL
jgi:competence protein ComEC